MSTHSEIQVESRRRRIKRDTTGSVQLVERKAKQAFRKRGQYSVKGTKKPWSTEEEELVCGKRHPDLVLARMLQRSIPSIECKRHRLKGT